MLKKAYMAQFILNMIRCIRSTSTNNTLAGTLGGMLPKAMSFRNIEEPQCSSIIAIKTRAI